MSGNRIEPELVVKGEVVWTGVGAKPLYRAALAVQKGVIAGVGGYEEFDRPGVPVVGGNNRLVMPGLVNGHVHLPMVLFRGLADDLPLMTWLEDHIWPAEAAVIDQETVYWATLLALAEMIESGTTCLAEAYFCASGVLKAVLESGIRAVVAQGQHRLSGPGGARSGPRPGGLTGIPGNGPGRGEDGQDRPVLPFSLYLFTGQDHRGQGVVRGKTDPVLHPPGRSHSGKPNRLGPVRPAVHGFSG